MVSMADRLDVIHPHHSLHYHNLKFCEVQLVHLHLMGEIFLKNK
jgi:hypothetical protein